MDDSELAKQQRHDRAEYYRHIAADSIRHGISENWLNEVNVLHTMLLDQARACRNRSDTQADLELAELAEYTARLTQMFAIACSLQDQQFQRLRERLDKLELTAVTRC